VSFGYSGIYTVAFSPDGRNLAIAGANKDIRLLEIGD